MKINILSSYNLTYTINYTIMFHINLFVFEQKEAYMKKHLPVLMQSPVFSDISENNLLTMLSCMEARVVCFQKNQLVFREGDPARYMGIVLSGRVQIMRHAACGSRNIIGSFEKSEVFGAAFACSGVETLPVSVLATVDSEILLIDCKRIINVCPDTCAFHAKLISNLLRIVAQRNVQFNQKLEIITQKTTRDKLVAFLFAQAQQADSNRFTISYNRQQLADYLGVSRCAMTAELSKLRDINLIHYCRNEFEILNTEDLNRY